MQFIGFSLDGHLYGLALGDVERIVRAVEATPLPGAPSHVLGAVNVHGSLVPVLSLRRRLHLPDRDIHPSDQFLITLARNRRVALVIDEPAGVFECDASAITDASAFRPGLQRLQGAATLPDGLLLIPDLQAFFSLDEELALDESLEQLQ